MSEALVAGGAACGELAVFDLPDEPGLDPVGSPCVFAGDFFVEGARFPGQGCEFGVQVAEGLGGESGADVAEEPQRAVGVVGAEEEGPDGVGAPAAVPLELVGLPVPLGDGACGGEHRRHGSRQSPGHIVMIARRPRRCHPCWSGPTWPGQLSVATGLGDLDEVDDEDQGLLSERIAAAAVT